MQYSFNNPALSPPNRNLGNQYPQGQPVLQQGQPALVDPTQPNPPPPALSGNARMSSKMPAPPSGQIDMRSEGMIRMGSAGLQAASDPSGAGGNWMAAIGNQYGAIQDYNRQAEAAQFEIEESRRVEQARAAALSVKSSKTSNKDSRARMDDMAVASAKYSNAMEVIAGFDSHDGVVGPMSLLFRKWDQLTGNQRENVRLKIAKLKVDDTLSYVAQTKGAVSDKEMAIFSSAQPNWTDGEDIWRTWVSDYAEALRVMNDRLAGGTATGTYSDGSTSGQFIPGGGQGATSGGFSFVD